MTAPNRVVALCHDIERGLGHVDVDPEYAALAERSSPGHLTEMLQVERELGVRATYNVVGCMLETVREEIERDGHLVAFHSFDHGRGLQLERLAALNQPIDGYRAPGSRVTPELSDENLARHGYRWFASSAYSLDLDLPRRENGLAKIPVHFDDFELYQKGTPYERWKQHALDTIASRSFTAFGLHDCYARYWIDDYRDFLVAVREMATFVTFGEIAQQLQRSSV